MFWADQLALDIKEKTGNNPQWVDDMKTPSGRIHVGSLRGVLIHDLVFKALSELGVKATYSYVFNDMDPMDGLPQYLDKKTYEQYMGVPLINIPAPDKTSESLASQYGNEFIETMHILGVNPKIIWSHELYQSGSMNDVIKEALDKAPTVRKIYREIGNYERGDDWYPFQVICPTCGKLGTTQVTDWDGKNVRFVCKKDLVKWAAGCGFEGEISPFDGNGKLMWKVDWPAHWKVIGVTVEGAGKDHSSSGGSRDMAQALLAEVFNYPNPFDIPYEWFLIGGHKMSSSKGVGTSAREFADILPPSVGRFLFTRSKYTKQMNFDPSGATIPDLFDEYDKCAHLYWSEGKTNDQGRAWEMAQIGKVPESFYLPRFLDVANYMQMPKIDLPGKFSEVKGSSLSPIERDELETRMKYAKIWIEKYAPDDLKFTPTQEEEIDTGVLNENQKLFLGELAELLGTQSWEPETFQNELYQKGKSMGLAPQEIFKAVYISLIGKDHGPKAAWLILDLNREFVINRLKNISLKK